MAVMKPRCIYSVRFLRRFNINAITLYPFILFADSKSVVSERLFRHELEHIYQVQQAGWLQFYFLYLKAYFSNRLRGLGHQQAYFQNPYEISAREAEGQKLKDFEWAALGFRSDDSQFKS